MLKRILFNPGVGTLWPSIGVLILRVSTGLFMLLGHGWGKLTKFGKLRDSFGDPLGIGSQLSLIATIGAEVVAATFLVLGLCTRCAAGGLAFTMAVAAFMVHAGDDFATKEMALLYLAPCMALIFTGGGRFSADRIISK